MAVSIKKLFSFTSWARTRPNAPVPGDQIDNEFAEVRRAVTEVSKQVDDVRRSDGHLVNHSVHKETLAPELLDELTLDFKTSIQTDLQQIAANTSIAYKSAVEADASAIKAAKAETLAADYYQQLKTGVQPAIDAATTAANQLAQTQKQLSIYAPQVKLQAQDAANYAQLSEKYADLSELWAEWMGQDGRHDQTIPPNALAIMGISGDHWSARWWATKAANAFGKLQDLYLGVHTSHPLANLTGGGIAPGSIYYNSTSNLPYVWNGQSWKPFFTAEKAYTSTLYYKATAGQTIFDLTQDDLYIHSFTFNQVDPEAVEVYVNGVRLVPDYAGGTPADYVVDTVNSTITVMQPLTVDSVITIDVLTQRNLLSPGAVNFHSLRDIDLDSLLAPGQIDGTRKNFPLVRNDAKPVNVTNNEQLFVSIDGVVQEPGVDFQAAGASVTFTKAPLTGQRVWMFWMEPGSSNLPGVLPPPPPQDLIHNLYNWTPTASGGKGAEWVDGRGYFRTVANAAARVALNDPIDIKPGSLVIEQDTGDIYAYAPGTVAGTWQWVKIYALPTRTDIWQGLQFDPATPGFIEWEDLRGTAETVQNTADLTTIPPSHLNYGKLVFAQDTSTLYFSLVDTLSASGTMNDWQAIIPHAEMWLTAANLPDPATAQPPLMDGQLAIVSLDAVNGKTINRPYFYDFATHKWQPLSQMQMSKALRADADRTAFAKDDMQVTYENGHQELKFWDGTAWQTIYSYDAIKNLVASSSLFEGTAQEVGGTAVGAVQLNALPNLSALATAVDLTKVGHYWVWQGTAKYAVTAATPSIGADLAGVTLEPGDWLSISNTGTALAPVFKWTVIRGDLISKSRGDTLFGLSPYVAGSWEYGSTVVYQGSIYRATAGVLPTDPAPGATGSPWARVPLDTGFVTVAADVNLPATGTSVGQVYLIENSASAGGIPSLRMWTGTTWANLNQSAIRKYALETTLLAATPAVGSLGFSMDELRFFAYNGQRWTPFGFLTQDISEWVAARTYFSGDIVFYKDIWYRATNDTQLTDPAPSATNAKWAKMGGDSGAVVGDIKQSILTATQFAAVMGGSAGDWMLCDGRSAAGTVYASVTGAATVPDLRGKFVRMVGGNAAGLGVAQTFATGQPKNPFYTNTAGNHQHGSGIYTTTNARVGWGGGWQRTIDWVMSNAVGSWTAFIPYTSADGDHSHAVNAGGDNETRPDNVALNFYVKVN